MRDNEKAAALLDWYDRHARVLPWRISPAARANGLDPDPYRVWLSEIMLQQTTVAAVTGYFERFTRRWPDLAALAAAADAEVMAEWAGLGYYARARNLLKCARAVVTEHGGTFPDTEAGLRELPGIGPYTAAAIAAIAFDRPANVVDGNVERVMARLFAVEEPLPKAKKTLTKLAADLVPTHRPGDYAQALMDLGATICTPRTPACGLCPLRPECQAERAGVAADLPKRAPKAAKPVRFGYAYVVRRSDGAWLLQRRPDSGLLGGMLGWPGSVWTEAPPEPAPPLAADWQRLPVEARHTFTHFHLRLTVMYAQVGLNAVPQLGEFVPAVAYDRGALPTVMRKVADLVRMQFDPIS